MPEEVSRAEKLRLAGIRRYGSEANWRRALSKGAKKAEKHGRGGFHHMKNTDPDKLKELSAAAARKRWENAKEE